MMGSASEESKDAASQAQTHYLNQLSSPLQAFKEIPTSGAVGQGGIYVSDDLCSEQWFQELRKLSHKRTLALFEKDLSAINLNGEN